MGTCVKIHFPIRPFPCCLLPTFLLPPPLLYHLPFLHPFLHLPPCFPNFPTFFAFIFNKHLCYWKILLTVLQKVCPRPYLCSLLPSGPTGHDIWLVELSSQFHHSFHASPSLTSRPFQTLTHMGEEWETMWQIRSGVLFVMLIC